MLGKVTIFTVDAKVRLFEIAAVCQVNSIGHHTYSCRLYICGSQAAVIAEVKETTSGERSATKDLGKKKTWDCHAKKYNKWAAR